MLHCKGILRGVQQLTKLRLDNSALCNFLFPDYKGKHGTMREMLLKDLSSEARQEMDVLLLPPAPGRDWKTLADKMGYSREQILYFESKRERGPLIELISDYESKGKPISDLMSFLKEMERIDVIEGLRKHLSK